MFPRITHFIRPLHARDSNEGHRAATPLELFFDLVVVIAFAAIAKEFHHAIAEGHIALGITHFIMAFLLVWWPWNAFTWFASAYDNDDPAYRITVMAMMAGSMIIAASLPQFFGEYNFVYTFIGYAIMRLAFAVMWFRVGLHNPKMRPMARRFVIGQVLVQCYWAIVVFIIQPNPPLLYGLFALGFVMELIVPWIAEKAHGTTWHRHHIIERFGLLNIIVLGEVLLAATIALKFTFAADHLDLNLVGNALCGVVIAFSMFWLYFAEEDHLQSSDLKHIFRWGYGHVIIFAAGVAVGAGLEVMNAAFAHHGEGHHAIDPTIAAWAISLPIALYVFGLWYVREFTALSRKHGVVLLVMASLIALSPLVSTSPYAPTALIVLCVLIRQIKSQEKLKQGT